jgi:hypothetical protein
MRQLLPWWLPLALSLGPVAGAGAQEDARALVTRAIAALGGEDRVTAGAVRVVKFKGTLCYPLEGPVYTGPSSG